MQTYNVVVPRFNPVDFISLYLQVPVFLTFYVARKLLHPSPIVDLAKVDLQSDQYKADPATQAILDAEEEQRQARIRGANGWWWKVYYWLT